MFRDGWEPRRGYGGGARNEIADLFRHDGPFTSVYLDARSDQPQAQRYGSAVITDGLAALLRW